MAFRWRPQDRQCDAGRITDSRRGSRSAARLMKLPSIIATRTRYAFTNGAMAAKSKSTFNPLDKEERRRLSGALSLSPCCRLLRNAVVDWCAAAARGDSCTAGGRRDPAELVPLVKELGGAVARVVGFARTRVRVIEREVAPGCARHVVGVRALSAVGKDRDVVIGHECVNGRLHRLVLGVA